MTQVQLKKILVHPYSMCLCLAVIIVAGVLVYLNSFSGVFLYDDVGQIVENTDIHSLKWPWAFIQKTRRPVLNMCLALNYAVSQQSVWSYHFVNLVIHILSGLLLFGVVFRTCQLPKLTRLFPYDAVLVAFSISLLWVVHPLQTESVTYIIQRAESLMGMFYLLALYSAVRFMASNSLRWAVVSSLACILSGLTKEVASTVPLVVLLYDRAFISKSFRQGLARHKILYAGLAVTWVVMLILIVLKGPEQRPTAGFDYEGIAGIHYALSQTKVVLYYLRLVVFPHPLVLNYLWEPPRTFGQIAPFVLITLSLLGAGLWSWRRHPGIGFLVLSFFLILMPSSSFVPLRDLIFEHRMYLPLACVIALLVLGFRQLLLKGLDSLSYRVGVGLGMLFITAVGLGLCTTQRNKDYHSETAMWESTIKYRPENFQAIADLALAKKNQGKLEEATVLLKRALAINPYYPVAQMNMGNFYFEQGLYDEAIVHYRVAIKLFPDYRKAHANLGLVLLRKDNEAEAMVHLEKAVDLGFARPELFNQLGVLLVKNGRQKEAVQHFLSAVNQNPNYPQAHANLAAALFHQQLYADAISHFHKAIGLGINNAEIYHKLAIASAETGDRVSAQINMRKAAELDPDSENIQHDLEEIEKYNSNK